MKHINYKNTTDNPKPDFKTIKTGNETLDNFISDTGGFVVGSTIFLTGTPGAGKTTLSVVLQNLLKNCRTSLYSREMTSNSVMAQMQRYKIDNKNAFICDKSMCKNIDEYKRELEILQPSFVIIDSLQIIIEEDYTNSPPKESTFEIIQTLRNWTDKNDAVLIIIGHVNKDGSFTGLNTIEHLFDAHLEMIFDKDKNTRILSWAKNRKGPIEPILYYKFGKESLEFFTEEQYKRIADGKRLEDYILEAMVNFMKSVDRTSPKYKLFKEEVTKEFNLIMNSNIKMDDAAVMCVEILKKKVNKYKM